MSILNVLQKRLSGDHLSGDHPHTGGDAQRTPSDDSQLPIPGYDRINEKHLIAKLSRADVLDGVGGAIRDRHRKRRPGSVTATHLG
jgi:hypothetical protein